MVTRLSTAAISRSNGNVPSIDPSSTSTISKVSPLASITDLSRAYKSVTFSCSLWSGTTIEYLSTVFFIIRERAWGRSDFREAGPHSEACPVPGNAAGNVPTSAATSAAISGLPCAPFLRVFFARVGFHDCGFRGRGGGPPPPHVFYLVPPPPSPLV